MLEYLSGIVRKTEKHQVVLEVASIGFSIQVPDSYVFPLNKMTIIYSYLHWHQENGPQLFGFFNELDRAVFCLIISCSGIGPKIALTLLAHLGAPLFLQAIASSDQNALASVTGIGAKKAEQMIVGLKHKVAKLIESGVELGHASGLIAWHEVVQALESLNYSKTEVGYAITQLKNSDLKTDIPFDQLLRKALSYLTKQS